MRSTHWILRVALHALQGATLQPIRSEKRVVYRIMRVANFTNALFRIIITSW